MINVGDVTAVREEFASDGERSKRSGAINVNDSFSVSGLGMSMRILNTREEIE